MRAVPAWAVLAVCCAAQFMVVLDVAIVNVALPQMRHSLGLSITGQQWVINAYTLTFAGFLMLGGRAADLFGRRLVFLTGLTLFTVCSLLGGLAQNGSWLIAARAVQGIGSAILAPATLSLLMVNTVDPDKRRKAIGAWSATAASGTAAGVLLGGMLTDLAGWRWVLFVNVPIGVALLALARLALTESKAGNARSDLDLAGAVTVTAGLALLIYGIVGTDAHLWGSGHTLATLAAGVALLGGFAVIETRVADNPLIPGGIFATRGLPAANLIAGMNGAALYSSFFFLSLYLQQVNGYSPLQAGLAFFPTGLATLAAALGSSRLIARFGARRQLLLGPALAVPGLAWMSTVSPGSPYATHLLGPLVLIGAGLGLSFVAMTIAATSGVPAQQAGLASGLVNTSRQFGGALGLAILAAVAGAATRHSTQRHSSLPHALTSGYDRAFLVAGAFLVLAFLLARLVPRPASAV